MTSHDPDDLEGQSPADNAKLLTEAGITMGMHHSELAEVLGTTRRTYSRWARAGTRLFGEQAETMARLVHPRDRALAERFATIAGATLVSLGLEAPPAPPRMEPKDAHLAAAIVCAAAEAIDVSPRAVRPGLLAAVRCARELGLDLARLEGVLAGRSSAKAKGRS
jgi:hypothetical protein